MPDSHDPSPNWESEILDLLNELTAAQDEMLNLLSRKRQVMASGQTPEAIAVQPEETELCDRLVACHSRRHSLLQQAAQDGLPHGSIHELVRSLPGDSTDDLERKIQDSQSRVRLLQHESLANWVVAQRAVLHLAQILEILATGGKLKPTYESGETAAMRGNLINEQA